MTFLQILLQQGGSWHDNSSHSTGMGFIGFICLIGVIALAWNGIKWLMGKESWYD